MTIKAMVRASGMGLMAMIVLAAAFAGWRIDMIRMGGPVHHQAKQTADLIADVLPPPAYVIEAYLEATLLLRDSAGYARSAERLKALRADYDVRLAYWQKSDLDPVLLQVLVARSQPPARAFWAEIDEQFLPAVRRGDAATMQASYARLTNDYTVHRSAIDAVVRQATAYQAALDAEAAATLRNAAIVLTLIGVLIFAAVAAFCTGLRRWVIEPTVAISQATAALAGGQKATVPHLERTDELGCIANAVEQFRIATEARASADAAAADEQRLVNDELVTALRTMAGGDLTRDLTGSFPPSYAGVGEGLDRAVDTLRSMIRAVTETAGKITHDVADMADASQELGRRTQSTAAGLEQTSATLMQIDNRLKSVSIASAETATRAGSVLVSVGTGQEKARGAVRAMERVSSSASGIVDVIEGLDKIAFQTRVLAMNAAVEAGLAGDAGRGFGLVATLVSALAQRAEDEAKRGRDQLSMTRMEIGSAIEAVGHVDGALSAIAQDVDEVHTLLGGIASDNQVQSSAVTEITLAISGMDMATQQNAALVEQASHLSSSLSLEVDTLFAHASAFKIDGDGRHARAVPALA